MDPALLGEAWTPVAFAILAETLGEKSIVLRIVPRPTTPVQEYASQFLLFLNPCFDSF